MPGQSRNARSNAEVLLERIRVQLATGIPTTPSSGGADYTGIGDGRKVVAVAGTAETLAASTPVLSVTIQAELDNTGKVSVGTTSTVAADGTASGIVLEAGDTITIDIDDLAKVYVNATVASEGVSFIYFS